MKILSVVAAVLSTFVFSGIVYGEVILEDHFDTPASSDNWTAMESATEYDGDVLIGTNTSTSGNFGLLVHNFTDVLTEFTTSVKINITKNGTGGVGFCFCLQDVYSPFSTYTLQVIGDVIMVYKYVGGVGTQIYYATSGYITAGDNVFTVSKNGALFNVFVNNQPIGQFTDSEYASGDLALLLPDSSEVIFDDVSVVDTSKAFTSVTYFIDKFDDGNPKGSGWLAYGDYSSLTEEDGALNITTTSPGYNMYANVSQFLFSDTLVVSYQSGRTDYAYGMIFMGEPVPGEAIPMCSYFVTAGGTYQILFSAVDSTVVDTPSIVGSNSAIRGEPVVFAGDTIFRKDTLVVKRETGDDKYYFFVNGTLLDSLDTLGFDVASIGLSCSDSLSVDYEYFVAAEPSADTYVRNPFIKPSFFAGLNGDVGTGKIYSSSGRLIARFDGDYRKHIRNLSMGAYFIVLQKENNIQLQKTVVIMK